MAIRPNKRQILSGVLLAALLTGCSFVVELDGQPYHVSIRPLGETALPTATNAATLTAAPPTTPTPGMTLWPTPTQEAVLPTPTATTTPRPTPEKGNCLVKLGGFAINERTAPSASAPRTATSPIPAGSIVLITDFSTAEGYLWAHDVSGWFVVRQGETWWVTFTEATLEWCLELPGYPPGVQPPIPIVRALPGVWAGPGANRDELLRFGAQVRAAGQPAATVYGDAYTAELLLANGWFVMRRAVSVPDCPDTALPAEISAASFIGKVIAAEGVRAQVIVGANECAWPSAVYARDWVRAAVQTAKARGVRAVAPVVWNPGAPELDWVPVLAPAYRDAPIVVAWALNLYPARANTGLAVHDDFTAWTTWRYEMYRHHLRGVPFVVTEYARGDGSEPPDFADIRAWWALARYQVDVATAWYAAAPLGHWAAANLRGRLGELAKALR